MTIWVEIAVGLTLMAAPDPSPSPHPVPDQPEPGSVTSPLVAAQPGGSHLATGVASWYGTGPGAGHAAAGPALRRALGSDWRGTHLTVTFGSRHVEVVVDDWCQCYWKTDHEHLIDLSDEDFASLADPQHPARGLSRGVIKVEVTR